MAVCAHGLEPATPLSRLARQAWTVENGLPQNTVSFLLQSHDGYLWAGTEVGLARFDGNSFKVYDRSTTRVFPNAEIRCLLEAGGGNPQPSNSAVDGLWVGTGEGIVHWRGGTPALLTTHEGLPSDSIKGLIQTSNGTLWANTEQGLSWWDGRSFHSAPDRGRDSQESVTSMAADAQGGLWIATSRGIHVLRQEHWLTGAEAGLPATSPALVSSAGKGDVLIGTASGIFLFSRGTISTLLSHNSPAKDVINSLSRLATGSIVASTNSSVTVVPSATTPLQTFDVGRELPGSRIEAIYPDREGNLWIGTNHGLARLTYQARPGTGRSPAYTTQRLSTSDPLSSSGIVSFLEDREGDLWVGTETIGLQILRDARFRTVGSREGLSSDATTAIVQRGDDTLLIGTRDHGINVLNAEPESLDSNEFAKANSTWTTADGLLSNVILALATTMDGDVWAGTPDGLNRIHDEHGKSRISTLTSSDGLPDDFIRSLQSEPDGSLWIGTRRGLTHLDHGRLKTFTTQDGLGSDLVGAMARTADGDLWIATLQGLSRMHGGAIRNYTTADGLSSNVITALDVTEDGMLWIGTQGEGLSAWDPGWSGGHFIAVDDRNRSGSLEQPADIPGRQLPVGIHALLHDDRGHLWLASDGGLARVDVKTLEGCIHGEGCRLNATHFSTADGLRSRETSSNSHPTACRSRDGRLWFTTPKGLIVVDPLHFAEMPGPPPVVLEHFAVDDQSPEEDSSGVYRIAAGKMRFQFDYAGLSFAAPQKLRYEYMLEGFDHDWTYAGSRRTAYYTNIPPGPYRFRVRATLNDVGFSDGAVIPGVSSQAASSSLFPEADLALNLQPHFYRTLWFRALLLLVIAACIVWMFRRRLHRVRREYSVVMAERNRIAREIHDTLAQGYVGISLQLEVLGELLRHNRADAASRHLAMTQSLVRDGLDDARQSIWALRSQDAREHNLPVHLRRLVEKTNSPELAAVLEVHGAYRPLDGAVEKEILRIAQESLQNVKRHAAASEVRVRLDYDDRALTVMIADDGIGFVPLASDAKGRAAPSANGNGGHFGLTGMRERASLIRAQFAVASEPGNGTTVTLRVPAPEASGRRNDANQTSAAGALDGLPAGISADESGKTAFTGGPPSDNTLQSVHKGVSRDE